MRWRGTNRLIIRVSVNCPFEFLWLQEVNSPDLRLLVYSPRSQETADKIAQLLALEFEG